MVDVIVDCHNCKFEYNGECVPRSEKMKFPNCYKSSQTNEDRLNAMTTEEKAEFLAELCTAPSCTGRCHKDYEIYGELRTFCHDCWLDWLKQEAENED